MTSAVIQSTQSTMAVFQQKLSKHIQNLASVANTDTKCFEIYKKISQEIRAVTPVKNDYVIMNYLMKSTF